MRRGASAARTMATMNPTNSTTMTRNSASPNISGKPFLDLGVASCNGVAKSCDGRSYNACRVPGRTAPTDSPWPSQLKGKLPRPVPPVGVVGILARLAIDHRRGSPTDMHIRRHERPGLRHGRHPHDCGPGPGHPWAQTRASHARVPTLATQPDKPAAQDDRPYGLGR